MTLAEALAAVGGTTGFGDTTRIKLYREGDLFTCDLLDPKQAAARLRRYDIVEIPAKPWIGR